MNTNTILHAVYMRPCSGQGPKLNRWSVFTPEDPCWRPCTARGNRITFTSMLGAQRWIKNHALEVEASTRGWRVGA